MNDFVFYNPTKIIFGRSKENLIGKELQEAGVKKVLLVYGKNSLKKSGLFERIVESLKKHAVQYVEFGGVVSNPVLSHTRKGIELAKKEQVEAILAVGGGSVLDEGKAIAAGAQAEDDIWNYFITREIQAALPIFTVLTLAATGSEMNGGAVITNEATKQKYNITSPFLYPKVSILNPELTCSVPPDYSAYGAVDAVAHVIEAYFTRAAAPVLQDRIVESIIKTVLDTSRVIMREPNNYEARAEFMWAATLALNGLTTVGLKGACFPNHMIEHSLSALYNIAHGAGLAIVIPAWMKWYSAKHPAQFVRFSKEVFGLEGAAAGIEAFEKWCEEMHVPTRLHDVGISAQHIDMIAENAAGLAKLWEIDQEYHQKTIAEILILAA